MDVKEPFSSRSAESSPSKVQFVSSGVEEKRGEVKVAISGYNGIKIGLNKEELMKYANDPFWIKVRMLSFILFWIVWWATLAGSTVIIFYTPKCSIQSDVNESTGIITTTLAGVMDNSTNVPIVSTLASTITTAASTVASGIINVSS